MKIVNLKMTAYTLINIMEGINFYQDILTDIKKINEQIKNIHTENYSTKIVLGNNITNNLNKFSASCDILNSSNKIDGEDLTKIKDILILSKSISDQLEKVLNKSNRNNETNGYSMFSNGKNAFLNLVLAYRQKIDSMCNELTPLIEFLVPDSQNSSMIVPSVEAIQTILNQGGMMGMPGYACMIMYTQIKNKMSKIILNTETFLNQLIVDLQYSVVKILVNYMQFDKVLGENAFAEIHEKLANEYIALQKSRNNHANKDNPYDVTFHKVYGAWIMELRNKLESQFNFKGGIFEEIYFALEKMSNLSFSPETLLSNLRDCLDVLDLNQNRNFVVPRFEGNSTLEIANNIHEFLNVKFLEFKRNALNKMQSIVSMPNTTLYSAISDFYDRMFNSCITIERDGQTVCLTSESVWEKTIYGCDNFVDTYNLHFQEIQKKATDLKFYLDKFSKNCETF